MSKAIRAVIVAAWSVCLLSIAAAGSICWRYLGVHEGGLVEVAAMVTATMVMVAGLSLASVATGIALAVGGRGKPETTTPAG